MKQSSIEWLMDKLFDPSFMVDEQLEWFEQAKAMHKEEITEAFLDGKLDGWQNQWAHPNDYYNQTFNTKEK